MTADGRFQAATRAAVQAVQTAAGLPPTGAVDSPTWDLLRRAAPKAPDWTAPAAAGARAASLAARGGPPTARLPARRNELGGRPDGT